jgi:hypothetical protein
MFVAELENLILTPGNDLDVVVPPIRVDVTNDGDRYVLSVRQTDNTARVRDGYIRSCTRGHARAPSTHSGRLDLQEKHARECPAVYADTAWEPPW